MVDSTIPAVGKNTFIGIHRKKPTLLFEANGAAVQPDSLTHQGFECQVCCSWDVDERLQFEVSTQKIVKTRNVLVEKMFQVTGTINPAKPGSASTFQSVDLVVRPFDGTCAYPPAGALSEEPEISVNFPFGTETIVLTEANVGEGALAFLLSAIRSACTTTAHPSAAVKLIFPNLTGFVARSDFITFRLVDCALVQSVQGFVRPGQFIASIPNLTSLDFLEILTLSVGGAILKPTDNIAQAFDALEEELCARISFPWLISKPIPKRYVAFVHANKKLYEDEPLLQAVPSLNLALVVISQPGHWVTLPGNTHHCEAFIPIDVTIDDGLPDRIAAAVRSYPFPIEAVFTYNERMHIPLAKAAEMLKLPTTPASAYEICVDKYATRLAANEDDPAFFSLRFNDADELNSRLSRDETSLTYPLVLRPTKGTSSEGVYKANNLNDLRIAMREFSKGPNASSPVIVETYINGPEFDANVIMCNGEILVFKLGDDFPSAGDDPNRSGASATFLEIGTFTPTNLPDDEVEMLQKTLHQVLLKLSFTWGVFHIEGRVKNSKMHYTTKDGALELLPTATKPAQSASCFLIEINARAPGLGSSFMNCRTYGVDFFGMQVLCALRDEERLRALSQPYKFPHGAQYFSELVLIGPEKGGIANSDDPVEELLERCPELRSHVAACSRCGFKKGDTVPDPASGKLAFLAFIIVFSRASRQEARRYADKVRAEFRFEYL